QNDRRIREEEARVQMNAIELLAAQPWVDRLGSTLLDFLWQGAIIAGIYAVARRCLARSAPNIRYVLACVALGVMVIAFIFTWIALPPPPIPRSAPPVAAQPPPAPAPPSYHPRLTAVWIRAVSPDYLPWVVCAWFAGAMALCLRLSIAWISAERLR